MKKIKSYPLVPVFLFIITSLLLILARAHVANAEIKTLSPFGYDSIPPKVSITSPTNRGTVSGTITLSADATDNIGVTKVEFYRGSIMIFKGSTLLSTATTPPYTATFDTTTVPNSAYLFTAKAYDAAGNVTTSPFFSIVVNNVPPDTTAPTIPSIAVESTSSTSATITWITNEPSTSQVQYGTTTSYDLTTVTNTNLEISHTVTLSDLTPDTLYHFSVISADASNNSTTSGDNNFMTVATAPVVDIIPPTVSITNPINGTVSGTVTLSADATDNVGVTKVEFYQGSTLAIKGATLIATTTTPPYTATFDSTTIDNGTYLLTAKAYDAAGNVTTSPLDAVSIDNVPADTTAPTISSVASTAITTTGATITWTTDENSDSQVEYGTTSTYGTTMPLDSTPLTSHSVSISGLTANTLYHYHVISSDISGNKAVSDDNTFTTSVPLPCVLPSTNPKIYYVSTSDGTDTGNGALCAPWKTLDQVSKANLKPGDTVLFKRGDTFYSATSTGPDGKTIIGGLPINKSGSLGNPITYGAYGTGTNPIITGLTSIPDGTAGWTNNGNNIWESNNAVSTFPVLNLVLINGVDTAMGRWPNKEVVPPNMKKYTSFTYAPYTDPTTKKVVYSCDHPFSITGSDLSGTPTQSWGSTAEVVIYDTKFSMLRSPICSQVGTILNYQTGGDTAPDDNDGFFIQNDPATLDQNNEWYYNPTNGHLQIYTTNQNGPSGVQVPTLATLLMMKKDTSNSYVHDITIDGISFTGSNVTLMDLYTPTNFTLQNSDISFSGTSGIFGRGSTKAFSNGVTIQNSTLSYIHNNAIEFASTNPLTPEYTNLNIKSNTLTNVGMIPGMGQSGSHHLEAITAQGNNITIDHNKIENVGLVGIYFSGNGVHVSNNYINNFNMVRKDSGGIYTWNSSSNQTPVLFSEQYVTNNVVSNGGGSNSSDADRKNKDGIYLDNNTNHVVVTGNTVSNTANGIIINYGNKNIVVKNNTIYNTAQGIAVNGCKGLSITSDIDIENNISVATGTQKAGWFYLDRNSSGCFPSAEAPNSLKNLLASRNWKLANNIYARPLDDTTTIGRDNSAQYIDNTKKTPATLLYGANQTLADWQTASGLDFGSHKLPIATTNASDIVFNSNPSDSTSADFAPSGNYIDLSDYMSTMNNPTNSCITHSGSRTIPAWNIGSPSTWTSSIIPTVWTGAVLIKGSCPSTPVTSSN